MSNPKYEYKIEEKSTTGTAWYIAALPTTNAKMAHKRYRELVDIYSKYGRSFRLMRLSLNDWEEIERS